MHKYSLARAAKLLGTGRNRLIAQLKQRGILDHNRLPAQRHVDAGRFVTQLREHTGNPHWNNGNGQLYHVALVTPKGLRWLAEQLGVTVTPVIPMGTTQPRPDGNTAALEQARNALRLMQMHINCPTAVDSTTALAVAEEALQLIEQYQRSAA